MEAKKRGRPAKPDSKPRCVRLTDAAVEKAEKIGAGNISGGLERAVLAYKLKEVKHDS